MTEEYNKIVIEAIVTIGNCDSIKQSLEPNIVEPRELKAWMVKRTLYALVLLEDELERQMEVKNDNPDAKLPRT